ncbi:putative T-lymphocyte triggering factor [Leptomonas pyrrhocoris]|uniref:Putative T-lymphocyte triggering factor n=1 Tax=Leptomonas pyrrhocoris TaxID=157538 RepID=A0A0M9G159_LEPPY|nr:putative T-lymphocyte triggering factor [Leptomonas pyrrhocoris]KPA80123.1 putative T-lymphocyte triggering factor [Leptomonas pyrrhocoris]|eukprot:XP_015658562.1 putative T-lymphocyte triggering factor [Leptomonas pyrrhocoris]
MPPKRVAGKGKGGGAGGAGAAADPMAELRNMEDIHEVLAKAQQLRNYFQTERDKVNSMWDITKKELENSQYGLQNIESEIEELERDHQVEMKVYKQKVRHLLYDHRVAVKQLKDESDAALRGAETAHQQRIQQLETERQQRMSGMEAARESQEGHIMEQRDGHQYMLTVTKRRNHEKELARRQTAYEAKLSTLREDLELRRRAEIQDAEERYHMHINELIRQHEEKFSEMKNYYNHITQNNLEIIRSLKDEIATMKKNDEQNESLMYEIEKENSSLAAPLEQVEKEVAELQVKKQQHIQDKQSLRTSRTRYKALQQQLDTLRQDKELLEEQYKSVYNEREDLRAKFESALREAMDIVAERNNSLQQNLVEAHAKLEQRDAQLDGVLRAMNLEPAAMELISEEIDDEIQVKNQTIKDLHFELRKLEKRVSAMVEEYERRCRAVGVTPLDRASVLCV